MIPPFTPTAAEQVPHRHGPGRRHRRLPDARRQRAARTRRSTTSTSTGSRPAARLPATPGTRRSSSPPAAPARRRTSPGRSPSSLTPPTSARASPPSPTRSTVGRRRPTPGPISVNTAGNHTVVVTATDGAGNTGSASSSFTITAPAGSPTIKVTSAEDILGPHLPAGLQHRREAADAAQVGHDHQHRRQRPADRHERDASAARTRTSSPWPPASRRASRCPPAQTATVVGARSRPTTAFGMKVATLTIASNDPLVPELHGGAAGLERRRHRGRHRAQLPGPHDDARLLDVTGINGTYQATTRAPVGDEIIAPYFKRVDTTKPVGLYPIARYVAASTFTSDTGYAPTKYSDGRTDALQVPGRHRRRRPRRRRGLHGLRREPEADAHDRDRTARTPGHPGERVRHHRQLRQLHRRPVQQGRRPAPIFRNLRVYPAKGPGGVVIPNTWLVGVDINVTRRQELRLPGPGDAAHQRHARARGGGRTGQRGDRPGLRQPRSPAPSPTRRARAPASPACSRTRPARSTSRPAST